MGTSAEYFVSMHVALDHKLIYYLEILTVLGRSIFCIGIRVRLTVSGLLKTFYYIHYD